MRDLFFSGRWSQAVLCAVLGAFVVLCEVQAAELMDVRFGIHSASKTRIVLDVKGAPTYEIFAQDAGAGRIVLEFRDFAINPALRTTQDGDGLIKSFRLHRKINGRASLAFELVKPVRKEQVFLIEPKGNVRHHRMVIDVSASSKKEFLASFTPTYKGLGDVIAAAVGEAEASADRPVANDGKSKGSNKNKEVEPSSAPLPSVTSDKALAVVNPVKTPSSAVRSAVDYPVIVIDAGHGGSDPGAHGPKGTREKVVTLAAALELAELLKKTGRYKIVLTRPDDRRLVPHERAQLARDASPDLFLSIHADSNPDPKLRGASVYTLSQEGVARARREANEGEIAKVGDLDMKEVSPELGNILYRFAQRETLTASSRFANKLLATLPPVTPMLKNSHRQEDYRVLLAPDVPAVLLELAFISNAQDEKNLISPPWRKKTMKAVLKAIDLYFEEKNQFERASVRPVTKVNAG